MQISNKDAAIFALIVGNFSKSNILITPDHAVRIAIMFSTVDTSLSNRLFKNPDELAPHGVLFL